MSTPTLDCRPHRTAGSTPPALASPSFSSPQSVTTSSERITVDSVATTPAPMSSHDGPTAAELSPGLKGGASLAHSRHEPLSSAATRQQLPSLSSLFGPPTTRPLHSPASDKFNSSYPTASPLDQRAAGDRSAAGSYFAHHAMVPSSQPRSTYDDRHAGADRPGLSYPLKRTYSESLSVGHRNGAAQRFDSLPEPDGAGRWTVANEQARQEYTFGSREQNLRSQQEHFRLQFPASKQPLGFGEQRLARHGHHPPTPASTAASEGLPSKDVLGPKIWTGTHFLPRFVRAAEVPGEGMCFFYDDGSHCKTVIDGEAVNAHWGVTKAGKPRKRLAIACMTCREKKIKCDPDFPRCVQCEKFGRVCRFKNAPRGGQNTSPSTPPAELDSFRKSESSMRPADVRISGSESGSPVSPRTTLPYVSPDSGAHKRVKLEGESRRHVNEERAVYPSQSVRPSALEYEARKRAWEPPQISDEVLHRAWQTDPCITDPQSILAVLTHFFAQIENTMILQFLPQQSTMAWAANSSNRKTAEDLMLLYSMLAVGVALSDGPSNIAFEYAQVAHYAQKTLLNDCLQLVQTRIILALYYISTQRLREAGDLIAAAAATSASLQLRVEFDDAVEGQQASHPLNLNRTGFAESRRRTMWSLFMLERLWGLFPHQPAIINAEDICIRLPVDSQSFERQIEETAPLFDPYEPVGPAFDSSSLDLTGYWVEIVHLWSSCQSALSRQMRRSSWADNESAKLRSYLNRVEKWRSGIPKSLVFSLKNLEAAVLSGKAGAFCSMHLLYHHASITLARYGRAPHQISRAEQTAAVNECRKHSHEMLEILRAAGHAHLGKGSSWGLMPPLTATLVSEAVDILSSRGTLSNIEGVITSLYEAMPALSSLSLTWPSQKGITAFVDDRLDQLRRLQARDMDAPSPRADPRVSGMDRVDTEWRLASGLRTVAKEVDVLSFVLH